MSRETAEREDVERVGRPEGELASQRDYAC